MTMSVRVLAAFLYDMNHWAYVLDHAVHGRWDEGYVLEADQVARRPLQVKKGDITAAHLIAFMQSQSKPTHVFDEYIATEKRREVSSDE